MWGLLQKDLSEFVSTVKSDTQKVLHQVLNGEDDEEEEAEGEVAQDDAQSQATAATAVDPVILALQNDPNTYTEDIAGSEAEAWASFVASFDMLAQSVEMEQALKSNPEMTRLHGELVGDSLSSEAFWMRYFYRVSKAVRLLPPNLNDQDDEEDLSWGDDADDEENADEGVRETTEPTEQGVKSRGLTPAPPAVTAQSPSPVPPPPPHTTERAVEPSAAQHKASDIRVKLLEEQLEALHKQLRASQDACTKLKRDLEAQTQRAHTLEQEKQELREQVKALESRPAPPPRSPAAAPERALPPASPEPAERETSASSGVLVDQEDAETEWEAWS